MGVMGTQVTKQKAPPRTFRAQVPKGGSHCTDYVTMGQGPNKSKIATKTQVNQTASVHYISSNTNTI